MSGRTELALILSKHHVTTGMQVASGVTCQCGYWTGTEDRTKPLPWGRDRLDPHRADVILEWMGLNPDA